MPDPDEASVGWTVWERADALSDYEPRGGVVLEVRRDADDDVVSLLCVRVFHGRITRCELDVDAIDWELAARPSSGPLTPVVLMLAREAVGKAQRLDGWRRRNLVDAAKLAELL